MAIGSVKELIDYERETIKIARKYGCECVTDTEMSGTSTNPVQNKVIKEYVDNAVENVSVDLSLIADEYNPNRTTQYPINDMVLYDGKLYRATTATQPSAGEFNSEMWDEVAEYDSSETYNEYDYAVYEGRIYRCDESNVTGEWDSTKWTEVSAEFPEYNSSEVYYAYGSSKCTYEGDFYKTNSSYVNSGTVGEFKPLRWTETTVEAVINALKPIPVYVSQFTTDASGCLWLESPAMEGIREPFGIRLYHDGAFNGFTGRVEVVHKYVNDGSPSYTHHDYIGFKFYDGNGDALVNWSSVQSLGMTAGIGFLYYNQF